MKLHGQEMVTVKCSPVSVLVRRPIEVVAMHPAPIVDKVLPLATKSDSEDVRQAVSAQPAARPTTSEMMASMKALREQRATCDEAEIVLDQIVSDDSPRSLSAHIHREMI